MILTNVAVLMLTAVLWRELDAAGRSRPLDRTWLTVAGIFAAAGLLTSLLR